MIIDTIGDALCSKTDYSVSFNSERENQFVFKIPDSDTEVNSLISEAKKFDYNHFVNYITSRVKGNDKELRLFASEVTLFIKWFTRENKDVAPPLFNTIVQGPSGSGKTELYRVCKDYFEVNEFEYIDVQIRDVTMITPDAYGGVTRSILYDGTKALKLFHGITIMFCDEMDKLLMRALARDGSNLSQEAQACLLDVFAGKYNSPMYIDHRIMFVGLGSFAAIKKEDDLKQFGFIDSSSKTLDYSKKKINKADLVEMGAMTELVGRFPIIINLNPLSEDDLNAIIDMRVHAIGKLFDAEIELTPEFRKYILSDFVNKFGARCIDRAIWNLLYQYTSCIGLSKIDRFCLHMIDDKPACETIFLEDKKCGLKKGNRKNE